VSGAKGIRSIDRPETGGLCVILVCLETLDLIDDL
jgi:hypothetical protein